MFGFIKALFDPGTSYGRPIQGANNSKDHDQLERNRNTQEKRERQHQQAYGERSFETEQREVLRRKQIEIDNYKKPSERTAR